MLAIIYAILVVPFLVCQIVNIVVAQQYALLALIITLPFSN